MKIDSFSRRFTVQKRNAHKRKRIKLTSETITERIDVVNI